MEAEKIEELFEKNNDEFLRFERVQNKLSNRRDLHAFLLLDKLVPGSADIVAGASHDQIYLDVRPEFLMTVATEDHVIELIRCGVRYDNEMLAMFT